MSKDLLLESEHERRPNRTKASINTIDRFSQDGHGRPNIYRQAGTQGRCGVSVHRGRVKNVSGDDIERAVVKRNGRRKVDLGAILDAARESQFQARDVLVTEVIGSFNTDTDRA